MKEKAGEKKKMCTFTASLTTIRHNRTVNNTVFNIMEKRYPLNATAHALNTGYGFGLA